MIPTSRRSPTMSFPTESPVTAPVLMLALLTCLAPVTPAGGAETTEHARAPVADATRPVRLSAELDYATLTVEGYDGDLVTAVAQRRDPPPPRGEDGLRTIEPLGLQLHADGNRVVVLLAGDDRPVEVTLRVPRRTDLALRSSNGGHLSVRGVRGEMELVTSNAGIELHEVAGSALVSTSNGHIRASFTAVDSERPMSFVTSNDSVELVFPADLGAELYLETDGVFRTDFDLEQLADPGVEEPAGPPGSRFIHATVGSGGPRIRVRTDNGDVILRRATP